MASVSTAYISASTNRHSHAADAKDSLVAFGSSTYVALWNSADACGRGTYATLPGHEGLVTCVHFVSNDSLVSTDDRGVLKFWREIGTQWINTITVSAHSAAISTLAVCGDVLVTGASDSFVKIWKLTCKPKQDELIESQSIPLKGKFPLALQLATLPRSQVLVLAIGGTDRNVNIWTRSEDVFVPSISLPGHEDWVKSLAFKTLDSEELSLTLASGSQDGTIRLWKIDPCQRQAKGAHQSTIDALSDDLLDTFEESLGDLADAEEGGRQISLKRHILTVKDNEGIQKQYTVTFDALLIGHEAGVTSLSWRPQSPTYSEPTLLSTSTDSSLILWSPSTILGSTQDGSTSLWINRHRFGDIGGQRLGGFVGGLWAQDGQEALGWGWSGGWRRWQCSSPLELATGTTEDWVETGAICGHSAPVRGLAWSPDGDFLISSSLDQTTRIHGEMATDNSSIWHEIARPQVHGYDLLRVAFLSPLRFVSIADEKVARVFEAPREFIETSKNIGISRFQAETDVDRPRAATVPPLGLSNKATNDTSSSSDTPLYDTDRMKRRPFEGELAAFTLWPEIEKVFGHGYESISLAVSSSRSLAATACKATAPEHAHIRVYDTEKWQLLGDPLIGHTLTVTRIAFSPDDRFILSVSRDRSWRLFERSLNSGFIPVAADKSHTRIIWDCSWAQEGDVFATASRDKTVKIWHMESVKSTEKWRPAAVISLPDAATAVNFSSEQADKRRRLAIGLESGEIHIFSNASADGSAGWRNDLVVPSQIAHVGQIHQLEWRPHTKHSTMDLASCSEDGTLKVLAICIDP